MQSQTHCLRVRIGQPILTIVLLLSALAAAPASGQDTTVSAPQRQRGAEAGPYFFTANTLASTESSPRKTTTL